MAEADPDKAGSNGLLDELAGIDPHAFEDDECTHVFRTDLPKSEGAPEVPSTAESPQANEDAAAVAEGDVTSQWVAVVPVKVEPGRGESRPAFTRSVRQPRPGGARPTSAAPRAEADRPRAETYQAPPTAGAAERRRTSVPAEVIAELSASDLLDDESEQAAPVRPPVGTSAAPKSDGAASPDGREALIGELIDGRYRVIRVLGVGGIGVVYLCQHELLEKPVAIKILRREYVAHDDLNERFLNEARASSAIKSPRIVDTLDVGTLPDGTPYFVMECVDGETLASMLEREAVLSPKLAIDIAKQMSEGLEAAHAAGVIHRDLKPENVFLAPQPDGALFVKIFDFGIAKVKRARKRLTYAGAVFGTPHYMSPEQARGDEVDPRSDLYAIGVMLFEMLTGSVPFDGEDPLSVMSQHVERAPPLMSSLPGVSMPPVLEAIVGRCLAKETRDRYACANDLLADLQSISDADLASAVVSRLGPAPTSLPAAAAPGASASALPSIPVAPAALRLPSSAPLPGSKAARTPTRRAVVSAPKRRERGRAFWGGLIAAGVVSAGVLVWAVSGGGPVFGGSAPLPGGPGASAGPSGSGPLVEAARPIQHEVHFVLSPIDAHLFRGEKDLGQMPISVFVEEGRTDTLTVRRRGYATRKVVVDGSESRVVVGLSRSEQSPVQSLARKRAK